MSLPAKWLSVHRFENCDTNELYFEYFTVFLWFRILNLLDLSFIQLHIFRLFFPVFFLFSFFQIFYFIFSLMQIYFSLFGVFMHYAGAFVVVVLSSICIFYWIYSMQCFQFISIWRAIQALSTPCCLCARLNAAGMRSKSHTHTQFSLFSRC